MDFMPDWFESHRLRPSLRIKDFFIWLAIWSAIALALWTASTWPNTMSSTLDLLHRLIEAL
jgi:hypothetical protein